MKRNNARRKKAYFICAVKPEEGKAIWQVPILPLEVTKDYRTGLKRIKTDAFTALYKPYIDEGWMFDIISRSKTGPLSMTIQKVVISKVTYSSLGDLPSESSETKNKPISKRSSRKREETKDTEIQEPQEASMEPGGVVESIAAEKISEAMGSQIQNG